jgi:hypothetical protein
MTAEHRGIAKSIVGKWAEISDSDVDLEGYRELVDDITLAIRQAHRDGLLEGANYHQPGCPAICDDEGDQVLDDYGECCCDRQAWRAWMREQAAKGEE